MAKELPVLEIKRQPLQYQCSSTSSSFTEVTHIPERQETRKEEKQPKNKGPQTTEEQMQECLVNSVSQEALQKNE